MLRADSLHGADSGTAAGHDMVWVTTLSEQHGTLHACDADDGRQLFAYLDGGPLVAKLTLTRNTRDAWLQLLV